MSEPTSRPWNVTATNVFNESVTDEVVYRLVGPAGRILADFGPGEEDKANATLASQAHELRNSTRDLLKLVEDLSDAADLGKAFMDVDLIRRFNEIPIAAVTALRASEGDDV